MSRRVPPVQSPLDCRALGTGLQASIHNEILEKSKLRFLTELGARFRRSEFVLVDSGTSALALAIRMIADAGGGPVALPAYGCYDLATAADAAGVSVVLYDVEPNTLSPVEKSLRTALELGARTVVVAHLYGVPVNLGEVTALAARFGACVVDDAAQGVGGSYRGVPLGLHGVLGVLSFGRGKGLTGGSGGAVLVPRDSPLYDAAMALKLPPAAESPVRAFLATTAQWALARPQLYGIPASLPFLGLGETHYRPVQPASAIDPFALGVLSRTVMLVDEESESRRFRADILRRALVRSATRGIEPPPDSNPGYLRFPVLVPKRLRAAASSAQALGVMRGYPTSLASLPGFSERCVNGLTQMPGAEELAESLFTLPTHSAVSPLDLRRIERWLETVMSGAH